MLNNLLAVSYELYRNIQSVMVIVTAICALFTIIVVLVQPGNSNGISSISGGATDTFYGKNKGRSLESTMKRLTVICLVVMAVLMVAFFLLQLLLNV